MTLFAARELKSLVLWVNKRFTRSVYSMMTALQPSKGKNQAERRSRERGKSGKGKAKKKPKKRSHAIKRQGRTIPQLVFQIEQTEFAVIKMSELAKLPALAKSAHRSTSRDFRMGTIDFSQQEAEEEDGESASEEEEEERAPKRRKAGRSAAVARVRREGTDEEEESNDDDDEANGVLILFTVTLRANPAHMLTCSPYIFACAGGDASEEDSESEEEEAEDMDAYPADMVE